MPCVVLTVAGGAVSCAVMGHCRDHGTEEQVLPSTVPAVLPSGGVGPGTKLFRTVATKYRVSHLVVDLGCVDFNFECPNPDWAGGNLAEAARQLGKIVEHPIQN